MKLEGDRKVSVLLLLFLQSSSSFAGYISDAHKIKKTKGVVKQLKVQDLSQMDSKDLATLKALKEDAQVSKQLLIKYQEGLKESASNRVDSHVFSIISSFLDLPSLLNFSPVCRLTHHVSAPVIAQQLAIQKIKLLRGEVILVEGGKFEMGSPENEVGRYSNEEPLHEVVTDSIALGMYPVTQEQYLRVMGSILGKNPSSVKGQRHCPKSYKTMKVMLKKKEIEISYCQGYPVENVSKVMMEAYLNELTTQIQPLWKIAYPNRPVPTYVLPTEEQWEKATQEKLNPPDSTGITLKHMIYSGTNDLAELSKYAVYNQQQTERVGSRQANSQGFYDMTGNVWEMTSTPWAEDPRTSYNDRTSSSFVRRGGSWFYSNPQYLRASMREDILPDDANTLVGFRLGEVSK